MPPNLPPPATSPAPPGRRLPAHTPLSRALWWASRALFAAAVAALVYGFYLRKPRPRPAEPVDPGGSAQAVREKPVRIDLSRERFQKWTSVDDGIEVTYPQRYEPVRGFGKFTAHEVEGGIQETDVVAFRCAAPRSVISIALYKAPRSLSWQEWVALAGESPKSKVQSPKSGAGVTGHLVPNTEHRTPNAQRPWIPPLIPSTSLPPAPFAAEFGTSQRSVRSSRAGDRPALAISATSAEQYPSRGSGWELWRLESRLAAEGDTAVRITAGVHADQWEGAREVVERTLNTFRWKPVTPGRRR